MRSRSLPRYLWRGGSSALDDLSIHDPRGSRHFSVLTAPTIRRGPDAASAIRQVNRARSLGPMAGAERRCVDDFNLGPQRLSKRILVFVIHDGISEACGDFHSR